MDKKYKNIDKKVISFIPDGEFYYQKGVKAMQRERFDDAHKYLQRAVELSPNDPLILMQYGILIMEEGMFEEAYEILAAAHGIDPEEEDIIFYLAEVHAHLGLLRDAKIYAEKYISLAPDGPLLMIRWKSSILLSRRKPFSSMRKCRMVKYISFKKKQED